MEAILAHTKSRRISAWMLVVAFLLVFSLIFGIVSPVSAMPIPTTSILSVDPGVSVKLRTYNFPRDLDFTVTIGYYGTYGKGGVEVAKTNSGSGGSFDVTYDIPDSLKDEGMLAIRLDSGRGIYAYDWFVNKSGNSTTTSTTSTTPSTTYAGYYYTGAYPHTDIVSVSKDESVTVKTYTFPPNRSFKVRINHFGTLGVGGVEVGTYDSGDGGSQEVTFNIPSEFDGEELLAIRFDDGYYYAYDWFVNTADGKTSSGVVYGTGGPYTYYDPQYYYGTTSDNYTTTTSAGHPGMMINDVVAGKEVKVAFYDIPDKKVYKVYLKDAKSSTGGTQVGKLDAGEADTVMMSFAIPDSLKYAKTITVYLVYDGKTVSSTYFDNE